MYTEKHLEWFWFSKLTRMLIKSCEVHLQTRYSVQSLPIPFTNRYFITFGPSSCQCGVFQHFNMRLVSGCTVCGFTKPFFRGLVLILHQPFWLPYTVSDIPLNVQIMTERCSSVLVHKHPMKGTSLMSVNKNLVFSWAIFSNESP